MDIDQINDRIDALNELRTALEKVQEEAQYLGVEPEMGAIMQELGTLEGMAALFYEADREALSRAFERMAL
jgi:hypothetical protein